MRKYVRKSFLFLSMLFFCVVQMGFLTNGNALTLEQLQAMGIKNRKLIEKARLSVRQQKDVARASRSGFWPQVDLEYSANRLDEDTDYENKENSQLLGSVSYNLFNGFKDRSNLDAAEMMVSAKQFDLKNTTQEIKYRIAVRFLDIYRAKSRLVVAEKEVDLLRKQYQDAENRNKVGLMRKSDVLSLKVQLDDSVQKLASAASSVQKNVNQLQFETATEINVTDLDFHTFDNLPVVKNYADYETLLYAHHSLLKSLKVVRNANTQYVKVAEAEYYPSVDLAASYLHYGDDFAFGLDKNGEDEVRLSLDVNYNIFDGFKKQANVGAARIAVKRTDKDLQELRAQLSTELHNLFLDLSVAQKNLRVAESSVAQAEENQRVTDEAFKEGVESGTDVLVAVLALSKAQFNAIDARNEVFFHYFHLLRLTEQL